MKSSLVVEGEFRLSYWLISSLTNLNLKSPGYFAQCPCHFKIHFLVSLLLAHAFQNRAMREQTALKLQNNSSNSSKHVHQTVLFLVLKMLKYC